MKAIYTERQQFRQWWMWLLMSPLFILPIVGIVMQLFLDEPVGTKPMSNLGLILFSLFAFSILALFLYMRLETIIDGNGIKMNYRPFLKRHVTWDDVAKIEVIDYGFVGYGFRWWPKHGWIYNVGGHMGLKVHRKSGKHFTIGTQKADDLKAYLDNNGVDYSSAT